MMIIKEAYKGFKPLCSVGGKMILYYNGSLWCEEQGKLKQVANLFKASLKNNVRIAGRLLRREPKFGVATSEDELLIASRHEMLLVNLNDGISRVIGQSRTGFSDPLNICTECGSWLALWGDYGPNIEHEAVNVYGLTNEHKIEIIYTFQPGMIRHIHNIILCLDGGFYVLTGDNEKTAGIYKASEDFKNVEPVVTGSQQYRAVVGFDTVNGLLYATDSVNEPNHMYLLDKQRNTRIIGDLDGSCIYGTQFNGSYYFSTTVEPDERNRGPLSWISYKRGKGILSDSVQIVEVNDDLTSSEVLRMKKDIWPMKLMQYGAVQFPHGLGEELWIYPVAVKKYDGSALRLEVQR